MRIIVDRVGHARAGAAAVPDHPRRGVYGCDRIVPLHRAAERQGAHPGVERGRCALAGRITGAALPDCVCQCEWSYG